MLHLQQEGTQGARATGDANVKRAAWVLLQGTGITPRMFEPMALERRVLDPDFFRGLHGRMDAGCVFVRKIHFCTVRSYWREQFIKGDKTEKLSDEPPTDFSTHGVA